MKSTKTKNEYLWILTRTGSRLTLKNPKHETVNGSPALVGLPVNLAGAPKGENLVHVLEGEIESSMPLYADRTGYLVTVPE